MGVCSDLKGYLFSFKDRIVDEKRGIVFHNIFFKNQDDGTYGIPVPEVKDIETYFNKFPETLILNVVKEYKHSFFYNHYIKVELPLKSEEKDLEDIRRAYEKIDAKLDKNILYSYDDVKVEFTESGDFFLASVYITNAFVDGFVNHPRYNEIVFVMEMGGWEHINENNFKLNVDLNYFSPLCTKLRLENLKIKNVKKIRNN